LKIICCNIIKKLITTREKQKKRTKQPSAHHLRVRYREEGIGPPKLAGTVAIAASLRSRRGGGEGLRSREEPTYLVGAAAIVLVSGGGRMEVVKGGRERGAATT
jgi:hypothetical protein